MSFLDKIMPFFVGHRTEIVASLTFVMNALSAFDVIPADVVWKMNQAALPLGAAFFAAKVDRIQPVIAAKK